LKEQLFHFVTSLLNMLRCFDDLAGVSPATRKKLPNKPSAMTVLSVFNCFPQIEVFGRKSRSLQRQASIHVQQHVFILGSS
ncbi:hypothetical protein RvY_19432, partial [Ramazzottius varieornatus]